MHRYHNIEFLMTFDFDEVIGMYFKAKKENALDQLWQQWLVDFSRMDKATFISFEDYKIKALTPKVDKNINVKNILQEAEKIKNADQRGGI